MSQNTQNLWSDDRASEYRERYAEYGEDLALRIYTSHLIGADSSLVLHGGGNTSVKSEHTNILGENVPALYIKGSGWDLDTIEPDGFPGVDLEYCRSLRVLEQLSDEEMVNELRTHLFNAQAPNPSVETLLHAFLSPKFVDHSHADAIIALTNTPNAEELIRECFGEDVAIVPYIMPGFLLSRAAAEIFDNRADSKGMVLLKHGLFTYGESAQESYERHIELVQKAEEFIQAKIATASRSVSAKPGPTQASDLSTLFPCLRNALAIRSEEGKVLRRFCFHLRQSDAIDQFLSTPVLLDAALSGPLTPDHIIRTKQFPLILNPDLEENEKELNDQIEHTFQEFGNAYSEYFDRCVAARSVSKQKLDLKPRVLLIPGVGLIGVGETAKAAAIAADIYEHTIEVKSLISHYSSYEALPEVDLFDVEYWSLEQAKLKKKSPKPLQGQVALITGGAGAIGRGIASVLNDQGAEVFIADLRNVDSAAEDLGVRGIEIDITSDSSVKEGLASVCKQLGGIDILILNAGAAVSCEITEASTEEAQRLVDINYLGALRVLRDAGAIMKRQNTGGNIVIVSSKNVFAPGKAFSLYSASKAASHQLGKIAAMELATHAIRVNMVNPDAVFSSGDTPSGLWQEVGPGRAKAHDIAFEDLEEHYRKRNLLKTHITAEDVGRAVLFFVTDQTPTTGATLPVDGGVATAFPR